MKIAVITEGAVSIRQHFGHAPYSMVLTVEEGKIVDRERRETLGHSQFTHNPHQPVEQPDQVHGVDPASQDKHGRMAEAIADCEALLCRGMGRRAYESMQELGIRPVGTDIADIDEAVMSYIDGKIADRIERLH